MPYCLDRWDHIYPNGHRNTIDKTYLATEPSDSAVAFAISFPDKLPCAGCRYKLILVPIQANSQALETRSYRAIPCHNKKVANVLEAV
jgi:hypothetical protein